MAIHTYQYVPGDVYGDRVVDAVRLALAIRLEAHLQLCNLRLSPEQAQAAAQAQRQHHWFKRLVDPEDPADQTTALGYLYVKNFRQYKTSERLREALITNGAAIMKDIRIGGINTNPEMVSCRDLDNLVEAMRVKEIERKHTRRNRQ